MIYVPPYRPRFEKSTAANYICTIIEITLLEVYNNN